MAKNAVQPASPVAGAVMILITISLTPDGNWKFRP